MKKTRRSKIKENATRGAIAVTAFASLFHISCTSTPTASQHGAVTGGLIGAVVGGVAGDGGGDVAAGAAIGAVTGAVAGRVYENRQERERYDPYRHGGDTAQVERIGPPPRTYPQPAPNGPQPPRTLPDQTYPQPQPQPQPRTQPLPEPEPAYPLARKTEQPGHVISPHPPHNRISVEGFRSGDLAIDPTTDQVFRVP